MMHASARTPGATSRNLYARMKGRLTALRLSKLARAVKRQHLTYLSDVKLVRLEKALQAAGTPDVGGAFLEFGVTLGGSGILIAHAAAHARKPFLGFDVFGMIPPPSSENDDPRSKEHYRIIAGGQATGINGDRHYGYRDNLYDEVMHAFHCNGLAVDGRQISLIKGLFEDTWPRVDVPAIAFCHIDCDWYDPVRFCLEQVAPRLSADGVVLLDDYHDYGGCLRATDEFLAAHPDFELEDGPNVVVRRRH